MHRHGNLWIVLAGESGARLFRRRAATPGVVEPLPFCGEEAPPPGEADRSCDRFRPANDVAGIVNEAAALGLFDSLMLVAPPPALHALKRALLPAAGALVVREETRNLLTLPEAARTAKLAALLRHR